MAIWLGPIDNVVEYTGVSRSDLLDGTHGAWVDYGQVFRSSDGIAKDRQNDPNWDKLAAMKPMKRRR